MPESSEDPASSKLINPDEIKVEPPVNEVNLTMPLKRQLRVGHDSIGLYMHPEDLDNPVNGHFIGIEHQAKTPPINKREVEDRLLRFAQIITNSNFGENQQLATAYGSELQAVHKRYLQTARYRREFEELVRAHETGHYYQHVRLGVPELLEVATFALQGEELPKLALHEFQLRARVEAQCTLTSLLHARIQTPQTRRDMVVYQMALGLRVFENIDFAFNTIKTGKVHRLTERFGNNASPYMVSSLILATQNPYLLEDIKADRLQKEDFISGLLAFYTQLLQNPAYWQEFLSTVGSRDFQLALDRQVILARDELKKTVDEVNATDENLDWDPESGDEPS